MLTKTCRSVSPKLGEKDKNANKSAATMHLKAVKYKQALEMPFYFVALN